MSKVLAIVVLYNPDNTILDKVIKSIMNQVDHVIVIDNASSSFYNIEESENLTIKKLDSNIGLAAAQNFGISFAKENNYSHIILFDQDSVIKPSFINELLLGEKVLIDNGHKVAAVGPSFYDPNSGIEYPATVYNGCFIKRVILGEEPIEATFIIASGCLIRISVLDNVGLMVDELFIDYIDVEWSLRAKSKGYSVYVIPTAKMAHTIGDSRSSIFGRTISVHSPFRRYFLMRNSFYMLRQSYIPFGYKFREIIFNIIRFIFAFFSSEDKKTLIKYSMHAIKDGIFGKYGPYRHG